MASKFSKFLTFTAVIGAATAVGLALYKKKKDDDFINDDFDDFDDIVEFDDDFNDLDSEDRAYTSIVNNSVADDEAKDDDERDLSDSLTEEEKDALSDSISSDIEDEEDADLFGDSTL